MSNLVIVVLVIAVCWFIVALAAGIFLGTVMRRAGTLAQRYEGGQPADIVRVGVPASLSH